MNLIQVFPGSPLRLTDLPGLLMITRGELDLFVDLSHEGERVRRFLMTRSAGQALYDAGLDEGDDLGFWALPREETILIPMTLAMLEEAYPRALDEWLDALSQALITLLQLRVRPERWIRTGERVCLAQPARVGAEARGVWLQVDAADKGVLCGSFCGSSCLEIGAENMWYPVPSGAWLALPEGATVLGQDRIQFELTETASGVAWFHRLVRFALLEHLPQQALEEKRRLSQHLRTEAIVREEALRTLSSLVARCEPPPVSARPNEDLLVACRLIGQFLRLKVVPPAGWKAEETPSHADIEAIAQASRLRLRQITLRGEWWLEDSGPLLSRYRKDNQPVALLPSGGRKGYRLADPRGNTGRTVDAELARELDPVAHMFYETLAQDRVGALDLLSLGFLRSRSDWLTLAFCGLGVALLNQSLPMGMQVVFDHLVPGRMSSQLIQMGYALVMVTIIILVLHLAEGVAVLRLRIRAAGTLQAAIIDRVLSLPATFFRSFTPGDLGERVMVIDRIGKVANGSLISGLLGGIFSLLSFVMLFYYEMRVAAVAMGLAFLFTLVMLYLGARSVHAMVLEEALLGRLTNLVYEGVNGVTTLRHNAAEGRFMARWAASFVQMRTQAMKSQAILVLSSGFVSGFRILSLMVIFIAIAKLSSYRLSTGSFLAIIMAFTSGITGITQMVQSSLTMFRILPLYRRLIPLLEASPERQAGRSDPGPLSGALEISQVCFRYHPTAELTLKQISLKVCPGEYIALVGPSGCGKSTLIRLILGFEQAESGAIFFDQRDLRSLDPRGVRRQIGTVLQHDQLIPGSLFDNIKGASCITLDEAWLAAERAGIAEEIRAMPMGMHTMVTEGRPAFSGGQVQRLMLARALATNPRILILDEATSALDNKTQALVTEGLKRLPITRITVAHRLSTIVAADRIYVFDQGRIIEQGNFQALMLQGGLFAELSRRQIE